MKTGGMCFSPFRENREIEKPGGCAGGGGWKNGGSVHATERRRGEF